MDDKEPTFDELMAKADNGDLTGEDLQYVLNEYASAVRNEFEVAMAETPDNAETHKLDFCRNHMGIALADIQWLSRHSDSDSVRLSAAKFIVEGAIDEAKRDGDPLKEIFAKLGAPTQT
jgi:hypothetical protein